MGLFGCNRVKPLMGFNPELSYYVIKYLYIYNNQCFK